MTRARRAAIGALVAAAGVLPPGAIGTLGAQTVRERVAQAVVERERRSRQDQFDEAFRSYSKRYFGVAYDWRHFKAQGMAESGLNPRAKSWVGARGIMQIMPATFAEIRAARPELRSIDDPRWNIAAGIMHDRYLWRLYPDTMPDEERRRFMFAAYNAGEGTIRRAQGVAASERLDAARWQSIASVAPKVQRWRWKETVGYVERIEANHRQLMAASDASSTRGALTRALRARADSATRAAKPR